MSDDVSDKTSLKKKSKPVKSTIATAGANVDLDNLDSDEVRRCLSYLVSQTVHITSLHLITHNRIKQRLISVMARLPTPLERSS